MSTGLLEYMSCYAVSAYDCIINPQCACMHEGYSNQSCLCVYVSVTTVSGSAQIAMLKFQSSVTLWCSVRIDFLIRAGGYSGGKY